MARWLNQWPWPFLCVLLLPLITTALIGSQDPFSIVGRAEDGAPIVATTSPLGTSTTICEPLLDQARGRVLQCDAHRPPTTYLPGLLLLAPWLWARSSRPVVRRAAGLAGILGILHGVAPLLLDLHPLWLDCAPSSCGWSGFLLVDMGTDLLIGLYALVALVLFLAEPA